MMIFDALNMVYWNLLTLQSQSKESKHGLATTFKLPKSDEH